MDWIEFLLMSLASVFRVIDMREKQRAARERAIAQGSAAAARLEPMAQQGEPRAL